MSTTPTTPSTAVPGWFRIAAIVLLVWNLFGVWSLWAQYSMTPEALAALPQPQQQVWAAMPSWLWVVYALAGITGVVGALLLLLRRRSALQAFRVSLVAVLTQFGYVLFLAGALRILGPAQALPMPVLIILVAIYQLWLARRGIARGWLV